MGLLPTNTIENNQEPTKEVEQNNVVVSSEPMQHTCNICQQVFTSRNSLFRHIRSNCQQNGNNNNNKISSLTKQTFVIQFAYTPIQEYCHCNSTKSTVDNVVLPEAEIAGQLIKQAFQQITSLSVSTTSQISVAKHRHLSLTQEIHVAACSDIISLNCMHENKVEIDIDNMQTVIDSLVASKNIHFEMYVVAIHQNSDKQSFRAEQECTQYVYHYLFPFNWLPNGNELESWWKQDYKLQLSNLQTTNGLSFQSKPPFDSIAKFSKALKLAESESIQNRRARRRNNIKYDASKNNNVKVGKFTSRIRRPWHNFANPLLQGYASPNQEPIWRVLNSARFSQIITHNNQAFIVLEFCGDSFVQEQIRRIVATALKMTINNNYNNDDDDNDDTFRNIFEQATKADVYTTTPIAPSHLLYLAGARFHRIEVKNGIKLFFDDNDNNIQRRFTTNDIQKKIQNMLLQNRNDHNEQNWIKHNLKNFRFFETQNVTQIQHHKNLEVPSDYKFTLRLLREIVSNKQWPESSVARSTVIKKNGQGQSDKGSSGSFTIVNPDIQNGIFQFGVGGSIPLPHANSLFPELVRAIFDLEQTLLPSRVPSSHCAVNCNAQFIPHVDSGRGAGQSVSMIVGLGDYTSGGEIVVEGVPHNIHYSPLEFDGWKLRHWTNPYVGERYSLVWFTPEIKN